MGDVVITLNLDLLKRYWLSASAVGIGLWTSLNPAAQQQIIHYVSTAVHGHPTLTFLAGLGSLIVADMKQSPIKPQIAPVIAPVSLDREMPK